MLFREKRRKCQLNFSTVYSIRTIALDMRGYNLSERPTGAENYKISYIVEDLRALIEHSSKQSIQVCMGVEFKTSYIFDSSF